MSLSLEDGAVIQRQQRNRAVAAATLADATLTRTGLFSTKAGPKAFVPSQTSPLRRYETFEELLQSRLRPDPNAEAREALHALQSVPVLRDELAIMDDDTLKTICTFLGATSRDLARLGSVCRRLHRIVIGFTPQAVLLAPNMVSLAGLASDTVLDSLCSFFSSYKRGQYVRELRLMAAKHASTYPINESLPLCSSHAFPALVKNLPLLTYLDLRGVCWKSHDTPALEKFFFSDLQIAAPHLQTLKVGVSLLVHWSAGWWQRLPALTHLVVGSRRDYQSAVLPVDVFEMLRSPQRQWWVKFWFAMDEEALRMFFHEGQPLIGVRELALNVGDKDLTAILLGPPERSQREESRMRRSVRSTKMTSPRRVLAQNSGDPDACVGFPNMTAFTLANVHHTPQMMSKLLVWVVQRAPQLMHFNIVNTARVPPVQTRPKRQMMGENA
uniref:Uncharacterized protein TCIL3000_11_11910 n=1 Tax=Trypanosoma congolense (strain IL3000) TaxID=1068625 RepID=G0V227_TRYCI|nr:unnamed protein product [Trypanosoma congolense IL3000]